MTQRHEETFRLALPGSDELEVYLSFADERNDWAVVYVHGFGSTRSGEKSQALERACAGRGWTFAGFDFRGHGSSTGRMLDLCGSRLLEDMEVLQTGLARRGVSRLYPVGSSMGGWAAAWFTLRHPDVVPACAVIAPAFDFVRHRWDRLSEEERLHWRQTGRFRVQNEWVDTEIGYCLVEEIDRFPLEQLAAGWPRPLLLFHGMRDETIPYTHSVAFAERSPYPDIELRLYRGGDHRLVAWKDDMAEAACDHFARWNAIHPR
jgi:alpha-beta hydrolase superfamily lysophospholipase